jgi:ABC-2 type transport system permease protein
MAPLLPMLWNQTRAEFLKLWRVPAFSVTSMALPVVFFALIAQQHAHDSYHGILYGAYYLAGMGAYSVGNVMVFSFGLSVAVERGQRQDELMRATPRPGGVYLLGKMLTAFAFSFLTLMVLFAYVNFAAGVHLDAATWFTITWRLLLGAIPFVGLGFAIGYLAGPNSAPAVINLVYLPIVFASGVFYPTDLLPKFIQDLAPYLPMYAFARLSWDAVGVHVSQPMATSALYLAAYAVAFFAIAVAGYRREEARRFG